MRASESPSPFVLLRSLTFGSASSTALPTVVHKRKRHAEHQVYPLDKLGSRELCPLQPHPVAPSRRALLFPLSKVISGQ